MHTCSTTVTVHHSNHEGCAPPGSESFEVHALYLFIYFKSCREDDCTFPYLTGFAFFLFQQICSLQFRFSYKYVRFWFSFHEFSVLLFLFLRYVMGSTAYILSGVADVTFRTERYTSTNTVYLPVSLNTGTNTSSNWLC